jgi:uncharacterized protein (TIGR03437 family)
VTLQIGGMTLTPAHAGPQGTFDGLDQINVKLPSTLKGSGDVIVQVTAAGKRRIRCILRLSEARLRA